MSINLQVAIDLVEKNPNLLDQVVAEINKVGVTATNVSQKIKFEGLEAEIAYEEFKNLISEVDDELEDLLETSGRKFLDPDQIDRVNDAFNDLLPSLSAIDEAFEKFKDLQDLGIDGSISDLKKLDDKLKDISKLDDIGIEKLKPQLDAFRASFAKLTKGEGSVEDFKKELKELDKSFEAEKLLAQTRKAEKGFEELKEKSGAFGRAVDNIFGKEVGDKLFRNIANLKNTFIETNKEGNNFRDLLESVQKAAKIESLEDLNGSLSELGGNLAKGNLSADTFGGALKSLANGALDLGKGLTGASAVVVGAVATFALLAVAVIGAGKALFDFTSATAENFKELTKLANVSGVAIEKIQTYRVALEAVGLSAESLEDGLEALNDIIDSGVISSERAAIGLTRVGISLAEIERATPTERIELFVNALKNVQNTAERIDIAKALGGESGARTLLALADGADNAALAVDKIGLTLTKTQQDSLKNFNKEVQFLQLAFESLFQYIGADAAGVFADLAKAASDAFLELRGDPKVVAGFKTLLETVEQIVFFVAGEAIPVVKNLVEGISIVGNVLSGLQNTLGAALAPILDQAIKGFELFESVISSILSPIETAKSFIDQLGVVVVNVLQGNFVPLEQKINSIIGGLKDFVLTISGIKPAVEGLGGVLNIFKGLSNDILGTNFATKELAKSNEEAGKSAKVAADGYQNIQDILATANRTIEETIFKNQKLLSVLTDLQGERLVSVQRALDAGVIKEAEAADRTRAINKETTDQIIAFKQQEVINAQKLLDIETRDRDKAIETRIAGLRAAKKTEEEIAIAIAKLKSEKDSEVTDARKKLAGAEDALRQEQLKKEQQLLADRRAIQAATFSEIQGNLEDETKARQVEIDKQLAALELAEQKFTISATTGASKRADIRKGEIEKQIADLQSILTADSENNEKLLENAKKRIAAEKELLAGTLIEIDNAEKKGTLSKGEASRARQEIAEQEKNIELNALKEITEQSALSEQQREEIRKKLTDLTIALNQQEIAAEKEKREALIKDAELQFEMQKALADQALTIAQRQLSDREKFIKQSVDAEVDLRANGINRVNTLFREQFELEKQLLAERNKLEIDAIDKQIELQRQRIKLNEEENKSPTEQIAARTELIKLEKQRADLIAGQIKQEQDLKQSLFDFESEQRQILFDEYIAQLQEQGATEKQIAQASAEFKVAQINKEIERIKEVIKARQAEGASAGELLDLEKELLGLVGERTKAQRELNKLLEDQNKTFKESVDLTTDYVNKLLGANALFKSGADAFAEATKNNLEILKEFAAENDRLINEARAKFEEEQKKLKELQEQAAKDLMDAQEKAIQDKLDAETKANEALIDIKKTYKEKVADLEKQIGDVQTKALDDQRKIREKAQADRDALEEKGNEKAKERQQQFDNDQFDSAEKQIERLRNLRLQAQLDELNREEEFVLKKSDLNKSLNDAIADLNKARQGGDDKDVKAAQAKVDAIKKQLGSLEAEDIAAKDRANRKKGELDSAELEFNKKKSGAKSKDDLDAAEKEFNARVDTINKKFKNEEDFFKQLEQLRKNNDTKAIADLTNLYNMEQALLDKNLKDQIEQEERQRQRKEDLRKAEQKAEEEAAKKALDLINKKEKDEIDAIIKAAEEKIKILSNRLAEEERLFKKAKTAIENELGASLTAINQMFTQATQNAQGFFNAIITGATQAGSAVGQLNVGNGLPSAGGNSPTTGATPGANNGTSTANPSSNPSSSSGGNVFGGSGKGLSAGGGNFSGNRVSKGGDQTETFGEQPSGGAANGDGDNDDGGNESSLDPSTTEGYKKTCLYFYRNLRGAKPPRDKFIYPNLAVPLDALVLSNGLVQTDKKPNIQAGEVDAKLLRGLIENGQVPATIKADKGAFEKATQDIIDVVDKAKKAKNAPTPSVTTGKSKADVTKPIEPIGGTATDAPSLNGTNPTNPTTSTPPSGSEPQEPDIPDRSESGRAIFPIKENLGKGVRSDMIEIYHYYIGNFFNEGDPVALANFAIQYIDFLAQSKQITDEMASSLKTKFTGKEDGSLSGKEESFITFLDALLEKGKNGDKTKLPAGNATATTASIIEPTKQPPVSNPNQSGVSSATDTSSGGITPPSTTGGNTSGAGGNQKQEALKELGDILVELYETVTLDDLEKPLNLIIARSLANNLITLGQGKAIRAIMFSANDSSELAEKLTKILGVTITAREIENTDDAGQGASPTTGKEGDGSSKSLSAAGGANTSNRGAKGRGVGGASNGANGNTGINGKDGLDGGGNSNVFNNTFNFSLNATAENKALVNAIADKVMEKTNAQQKNQVKGQLGALSIS